MSEDSAQSFHRVGLGYVYEPVDDAGAALGVRLKAGYLSHRDHDITAEIVVESTLPGVRTHLAQERLNLGAGRSRKAMANDLTELAPLPSGDWKSVIEGFCLSVLYTERKGEPFIKIGNLPPREAIPDRVHKLIPERQTSILYGAGGIGKGWIATAACVAVTMGLPLAGLLVMEGRCLYLDWEDYEVPLDDRIKRISRGFGMIDPFPEIVYRRCRGTLASQLEEVMAEIDAEGIDLVVIDSVGLAMGAGGASSGSSYEDKAMALFEALRSVNQAKLLIDHISHDSRKNTKGEAQAPYGSIYKGNVSRNAWEVRADVDTLGDIHLGLYQYKVNHSQRTTPIGFAVRFVKDGQIVRFEREDVRDSEELSKGLPLVQQVEGALKRAEGPLKPEEIAKAIDSNADKVRTTLNRHKMGERDQRFMRIMDGSWALILQPASPSGNGQSREEPPEEQSQAAGETMLASGETARSMLEGHSEDPPEEEEAIPF